MFTGIIENTAKVEEILPSGTGLAFLLSSSLCPELRVDQSLSHNGVCLTVESIANGHYQVTAVEETLLKTNMKGWTKGDFVNLERCMAMNGRLDGHIVQGHVDTTGRCTAVDDMQGSWNLRFSMPEQFAPLVIEKGSICMNGISLTLFDVDRSAFSVTIIPYTYHHTNVKLLKPGDAVNLEFDIVGKYLQRMLHLQAG
jgi:riboflavin synthase